MQDDISNDRVKYGELTILGYNGQHPQGERGRRKSKYALYKRAKPNGVKRHRHYEVEAPHKTKAILDSRQHSISYTLSKNNAVIVEYTHDETTDMFQLGRSSESPIDFVVMDTVPGNKADTNLEQSTISRFACRIICDRNDPKICRIYAAGFNSSNNIFLGEKATMWRTESFIDGLTTNGILISHPVGKFGDLAELKSLRSWKEVSVGGETYTLRESRSAPARGVKDDLTTNILQDGTLIDLCGATLLWRSAEGLANTPTMSMLNQRVDELNSGRPQCPVGLNTLVIPRRDVSILPDTMPFVYLDCGHVQGFHKWGKLKDGRNRTCPMCLKTGPAAALTMGLEPAFYVDDGIPNYAYNPCGHMASEATIRYWEHVPIPHGTNGFRSACPFCARPIESYPGYIKLIFQDHVD